MNEHLINFSDTDYFSSYCLNIGNTFCPYLLYAEKEHVLYKTAIELSHELTLSEAQEIILFYALTYTEKLRTFRLKNQNRKGLYYCNNLLFETPKQFLNVEANQLLDWPHWILKCLYSQVGIMFGKFWLNEQLVSKNNTDVPPPPVNFLSIRSAIKNKDPYFISNKKFILNEMLLSNDSGEDISASTELGTFSQMNLNEFIKNNIYRELYNWSKSKLSRS